VSASKCVGIAWFEEATTIDVKTGAVALTRGGVLVCSSRIVKEWRTGKAIRTGEVGASRTREPIAKVSSVAAQFWSIATQAEAVPIFSARCCKGGKVLGDRAGLAPVNGKQRGQ